MPNQLVEEVIRNGRVPQIDGSSTIRREQKYGRNGRIDSWLSETSQPDVY